MAALSVTIVANVKGKDIPWQDLTPELRNKIATKLNNDAMRAAGYEIAPAEIKRYSEARMKS